MEHPALTYTSYLHLDELLAAQEPLSEGPEHDELLVHHGGKSGDDWQDAAGMDVTPEQVRGWFAGGEVEVIP